MRRPAQLLFLALSAQSCTCLDLPAPVLSSVDPSAAPNAQSTALTVLGEHFFAEVSVDFDRPGQSRVDATFGLELVHPDGRRFPLTGVTLFSDAQLQATLPAGLSPQTYDLFLVDPRGRSALLPDALQVYQGDCADNGSPCSTGNPCTTGDFCQGHRCLPGTPLANGTPCQLVCATLVEACQAGVCTPPAGGCP
jgi:hypothetical protein